MTRRFQVKGRRSLQFKLKTGNKFNPLRLVKLVEGLHHLIHQLERDWPSKGTGPGTGL